MLSFITTAAAATIGSALNDAIQYGYALATGNKGRAKMLHDIARATTGEIASVLAPNINAGLQQGESNAEQLRKLRLKASTTLEALREMDDSAVSKAMERVYAISTQTAREQIEKIISGATRGETISAAQQTDLEAAQSTIDTTRPIPDTDLPTCGYGSLFGRPGPGGVAVGGYENENSKHRITFAAQYDRTVADEEPSPTTT